MRRLCSLVTEHNVIMISCVVHETAQCIRQTCKDGMRISSALDTADKLWLRFVQAYILEQCLYMYPKVPQILGILYNLPLHTEPTYRKRA
jgi:hypothetical protein